MDEVGKFITTSNDYFFPLAAPIVYLAMVLLAWIAYRSRRRHVLTDRERLYDVLDGLQDLADGRLDSDRRAEIIGHLGHLRDEWDRPELRELSARLEEFLLSPVVTVLPPRPGPLERLHAGSCGSRSGSRRSGGSGARSACSSSPGRCSSPSASPWRSSFSCTRARPAEPGGDGGRSPARPGSGHRRRRRPPRRDRSAWGLYLAATTSWFRGARLRAVRLAVASQLISLSLIDVLESYVDQFAVLQQSVFELVLLGLVLRYRVRFLPRTPTGPAPVVLAPPSLSSASPVPPVS